MEPNQTEYEAMTVPELRALAEARGAQVPASARKDEVIAALQDAADGDDPGADVATAEAAPSGRFTPATKHTPVTANARGEAR